MDENRLKMNNKTEFIMFGSRQHLQKCTTNVININGEEIPKIRLYKISRKLDGCTVVLQDSHHQEMSGSNGKCGQNMQHQEVSHGISYKDTLGRPSLITSGLCKCNPSRTSRVWHQQNAEDTKYCSQACNKSKKNIIVQQLHLKGFIGYQ